MLANSLEGKVLQVNHHFEEEEEEICLQYPDFHPGVLSLMQTILTANLHVLRYQNKLHCWILLTETVSRSTY